jgi:hypothetical protein
MKAKLLMIGGATIAILIGLSSPAFPLSELRPDCAANPYGIDGQLSEQDLKDLFYVAFPQTAQDMRGRFGSPACFDAVADYYRVGGTDHYIAVDYSGADAIGWRAWGEVVK